MNTTTNTRLRVELCYAYGRNELEEHGCKLDVEVASLDECDNDYSTEAARLELCELLFMLQGNNPQGRKLDAEHYSLSCGDLVRITWDGARHTYYCVPAGWRKLTVGDEDLWDATAPRNRAWLWRECN